ncbi:MAG TPA: DUF6338 family protein [Steroidobacteraceae bacterium]|nr:DUF6338 family protein [Steroidobacteraceae bacterium]
MEIWQTNKLILFIGFVIPGFVSLKAYESFLASTPKESSKQLIDAVAYSCINYALLLWPISLVETSKMRATYPNLYAAFYVFVLLGAPVVWTFLYKKLRETQLFQAALPHPTSKPWDYLFGQRKPYWVIITLKDGKQIAGRYDASSFASSAPAPEQLYLEERWVLNDTGGFERPREDTAGVMILARDVETIEFFHFTYGDSNVGQKENK